MTQRVMCPDCHCFLRIAPDETQTWITCPRCLTQVQNPAVQIQLAGELASEPSPDAGGQPGECDECGEPVQAQWRYCPRCNAPVLRLRPPDPPRESVDAAVKTDVAWIGYGLIGIATLATLGILLFAFGGGLGGIRDTKHAESVVSGGIIVALVLVVALLVGMGLAAAGKNPASRVLSSLIGGVALVTVAGGFVVLALLACVIGFFAECNKACSGGQPPRQQQVKPQ